MSNIKRPDSISGYVHPTTSNYSKNSVYKTFSEGTNEKFESTNDFDNTENNKLYANYNLDKNIGNCQICNEEAISTCPCAYNDKKCKQGHIWYTDRSGKSCIGDPHKK
jgi:hypothetical protein